MKGIDVLLPLSGVVRRAGLLNPFRELTDPKRGEISAEEAVHLLQEVRAMFAKMLSETTDQHLVPLDEVIGQIRANLKLPELDPSIAKIAARNAEENRRRQRAVISVGGGAFQRDMKRDYSF